MKERYQPLLVIVVLILSASFVNPTTKLDSYWFDTNLIFQAGPSDAITEIKRIDISDLQLTTVGCPNCEIYEIGYTNIGSNNKPAGYWNQKIYCLTDK